MGKRKIEGDLVVDGKIAKVGGTSLDFLMADGSTRQGITSITQGVPAAYTSSFSTNSSHSGQLLLCNFTEDTLVFISNILNIGDSIDFLQIGNGRINFASISVTVRNETYTQRKWSRVRATKISATEWVINGDLDVGSSFTTTSGYQKFPTGLIIQWGIRLLNTNQLVTVTLPVAMPTKLVSVVASGSNINGAYTNGVVTGTYTNSNFVLGIDSNTQNVTYIAIGY